MNKKAFTLIELLAVITILGIVSLITVPVVIGVISKSKENLYNSQVSYIEKASKKWSVDNINSLPENGSICVKLSTLKDLGYLKDNPKNLKTDSIMTGGVKITYLENYQQYEFKYKESGC